jgi:hypothetical protein
MLEYVDVGIRFFKFWILGVIITYGILRLTEPVYLNELGYKLVLSCILFWPFHAFLIIIKRFL